MNALNIIAEESAVAEKKPMDRWLAFNELYNLCLVKRRLHDQINALMAQMKARGIDDAKFIKEVIEEQLAAPEVKANREENERRRDDVFDEFFAGRE